MIEFDDGSGSVLRIQPLRTPRDEAIYECMASNSVGEISATTRLTVLRGRSCATETFKRTHTVNFSTSVKPERAGKTSVSALSSSASSLSVLIRAMFCGRGQIKTTNCGVTYHFLRQLMIHRFLIVGIYTFDIMSVFIINFLKFGCRNRSS